MLLLQYLTALMYFHSSFLYTAPNVVYVSKSSHAFQDKHLAHTHFLSLSIADTTHSTVTHLD